MTARIITTLQKMFLDGWVFSAIMFVILTVRDFRLGGFESIVIDQLVLIRFPLFYTFALILLGGALLAGIFRLATSGFTKLRATVTFLILLAGGIMVYDYFFIYSELVDMLTPLGSVRPQTFSWYHSMSERLNSIALMISLIAMILCHCDSGSSLAASSKLEVTTDQG